MRKFELKIFSKDKKAINWFNAHLFFRKKLKRNFKHIKKNNFSKISAKKITLLTSPHIDKDAQEQFEYKVFKKHYLVCATNYKKFLNFLKNLKTKRLSDSKIILTCKIQKANNHFLNFVNYYYLNNFLFSRKNRNKKFVIKKNFSATSKLLKILDIFGETFLSKNLKK